ncbi:MAG: hypothetical protein AAFX94_13965, partial [Myxococcota bacterium]
MRSGFGDTPDVSRGPHLILVVFAAQCGCAGEDPAGPSPPESSAAIAEQVPAQVDVAAPPAVGDADPVYAAPALEKVRVQRKGRRAVLRIRWSAVVDATEYELQVARNLTFGSTIFERTLKRRRVATPPLPLGLYFVRVRARGALGNGPWSAAKAVAPASTSEPAARAERAPAAETTDAPLFLRVPALPDRTFAEAPSLDIRGRASKGATVTA